RQPDAEPDPPPGAFRGRAAGRVSPGPGVYRVPRAGAGRVQFLVPAVPGIPGRAAGPAAGPGPEAVRPRGDSLRQPVRVRFPLPRRAPEGPRPRADRLLVPHALRRVRPAVQGARAPLAAVVVADARVPQPRQPQPDRVRGHAGGPDPTRLLPRRVVA